MNPKITIGKDLNRRDALSILGVFGAGVGAIGAGCGSSAAGTAADGGAGDLGTADCVLTPESTEGPFFIDEKLNRSDLIAGETDPAITGGLPLAVTFNVMAINGTSCSPMPNAFVDIWHADVNGLYSDLASSMFQPTDTLGKKFLRAYQVTNGSGSAAFKTIYPGWYASRTAHIHFKVRLFSATGGETFEATSQLYFADTVSDTVYAAAPYASRGQRLVFLNTKDQVFNATGPGGMIDNVGLPPGQIPPGEKTIAAIAPGNGGVGYIATLNVGLKFT
ncbi:MAG: twin-arginine translocation pathway signal protein [Deltaproteobacteria bacterium]|nr:twin-arginine translocation pathway signal protein [Deltaproteobacteria bacterium]